MPHLVWRFAYFEGDELPPRKLSNCQHPASMLNYQMNHHIANIYFFTKEGQFPKQIII